MKFFTYFVSYGFFLCLILKTDYVLSQNITLDEVISLRSKSLSYVEEYLTLRKWQMYDVTKGNNENMAEVSFSLNKSKFDDKAESFFNFYYDEDSKIPNKISLQIISVIKYNLFLSRVKSLGYKLLNSEILKNKLVKTFKLNKIFIKVSTTVSKTEDILSVRNTNYFFEILKQNEYQDLSVDTANVETSSKSDDEPESVRFIANNYYLEQNFELASEQFELLVELKKANSNDLLSLANCYYNLDYYSDAIIYFKKVENKNLKDVDFCRRLAYCLFQDNKFSESIKYQNLVISNAKSSSDDYNNMGGYYFADKKYDLSAKFYKKALESGCQNVSIFDYLIPILLSGKIDNVKSIYLKNSNKIYENEMTFKEAFISKLLQHFGYGAKYDKYKLLVEMLPEEEVQLQLGNTKIFNNAEVGLEYKIISNGKEKRIKAGNFFEIQFDQVYSGQGKDSTLFDSRTVSNQIVTIDSTDTPPVYFKIFSESRKGDSIIVKQSTDSIMKSGNTPPFIKKGAFIIAHYKIVNVFETKELADIAYQKQKEISQTKGSITTIDQITIDDKLDTEAKFPGGQVAWVSYLQKNLNANTPVNNGGPSGIFQVIVKFIVSKDGSISDVQPETKHGYGMEEEAVRIIKLGPKWIPALQNGRKVNAYRRQPITFIVENEKN
jgi:tetratricopeptide (TPR) repeat protein